VNDVLRLFLARLLGLTIAHFLFSQFRNFLFFYLLLQFLNNFKKIKYIEERKEAKYKINRVNKKKKLAL
jgi:hypothetical protein